MQTPWGKSQTQEQYAEGITLYSTAGHGGFLVEYRLNQTIPEYARVKDGWYEEDCEWAIVALFFPAAFDLKEVLNAENTIKNWMPDIWEKKNNCVLPIEESHAKQEKDFENRNIGNYLVRSAAGDRCNDPEYGQTPQGMVLCMAHKLLPDHTYDRKKHYFYATQANYDTRGHFSYVIKDEIELVPIKQVA